MKKTLSILIAVIMLMSLLAGCGGKKEENKTVEEPSAFNCSEYEGIWTDEEFGWENGGMLLEVYPEGDKVQLAFVCCQCAPASRAAEVRKEIEISEIADSTVEFSYDDDLWENSGKIKITFGDGIIHCQVSDVSWNDEAMWGLSEGNFDLVKNDDAYGELSDAQEEYYESYEPATTPSQPVYDTSKASGLLAQSGLNEAQFKGMCRYIGGQYTEDNEYVYAQGRQFYAENPEEIEWRLEKYTEEWNDYAANGTSSKAYKESYSQYDFKESNSLEDYLNRRMYGPKGATILGEESEEIFKRMAEYPDEYIGMPFLLKNFGVEYVSNYSYSKNHYVRYGVETVVKDIRDNVNSPTVLKGTYDMYVIFTGNSNEGGNPVLYFSALFIDKCE